MAESRPSIQPPDAAVPLDVCLGFALGSLAMSTVFQAFSVLMLRYLTDYLGIAAVAAGTLIGGSKIFDAVLDPLIGVVSDRTESRWGRRRPYLLVGGVACAASFLLTFYIPVSAGLSSRIWMVLGALLAFAAGYGLFNIPYLAMPAEMSTSPKARTTLISYRVAAVGIGSWFASSMAPVLITAGGGGVAGHRLMAWTISAVALVTSLACVALTGKARFTEPLKEKGPPVLTQIKLLLQNRPFTSLVWVYSICLFGLGIGFAITPFMFITVMKANYTAMGLFYLLYYIALIGLQPMWVVLCRRLGKRAVYVLATPLTMLATLSWFWARPGEPMPFILARAAALGALGGSTLLVIQGMLPDTIQYDFIRTGLRREGLYAGVFTTLEKVALAFSAAAVGIVLGSAGYIASTGAKAVQPQDAISAIYVLAASPAICVFVSCFFLLRYNLPEKVLASPDDWHLLRV